MSDPTCGREMLRARVASQGRAHVARLLARDESALRLWERGARTPTKAVRRAMARVLAIPEAAPWREVDASPTPSSVVVSPPLPSPSPSPTPTSSRPLSSTSTARALEEQLAELAGQLADARKPDSLYTPRDVASLQATRVAALKALGAERARERDPLLEPKSFARVCQLASYKTLRATIAAVLIDGCEKKLVDRSVLVELSRRLWALDEEAWP